MKNSTLSTLVAIGLLSPIASAFDEPNTASIPLTLASNYQRELDINLYWLSEKLDGIRAYWTGSELLTRKGHKIYTPKWFTDPLPAHAIDGELWAGRGGFQKVARTVLDFKPDEEAWRDIRFMMFDLPGSVGVFPKRYHELSAMEKSFKVPHLKLVVHHPVNSEEQLFNILDDISARNGEGVMLRKLDTIYRSGRSDDLIKVKKHDDDEAIIVGYTDGKGKYKGMVGAFILRMPNGKEFKIGSGLSDAVRANPPEIGTQITYRYNGYTDNGIPKFARYLAIREGY